MDLIYQKKGSKKVSTIKVDENRDQYIEQYLLKYNNVIEVKDKIFNKKMKLLKKLIKKVNYIIY